MPFSRLYRREAALADRINYDTDMYNQRWPEQELDFTTYPALGQTTQIPATNTTSTNTDSQAYLRTAAMAKPADPASPIQMFNTGPFGFSDLINMDSNTVSPLDISSSSSVRTESLAGLEGQSPTFRAAPRQGLSALQERMCPLITGDTDTCEPSKCGPDAPCMNFTNLPPIEECASVPCITVPEETVSVSSSPPTTRASLRTRRPLTTKRSSTYASTSSTSSEDRTRPVPATKRPLPSSRPSQTSEKPATLARMDKKQRAKAAHSLVEKKYRENLNTKLSQLFTTLQNAQYGPNRYLDNNDLDVDIDDFEDGEAAPASMGNTKRGGDSTAAAGGAVPKFRKSEVLDDAMNYVNQTEVEMRHMENELVRLSERVKHLEKLVKCEDCSLMKRMVHLQVQGVAG